MRHGLQAPAWCVCDEDPDEDEDPDKDEDENPGEVEDPGEVKDPGEDEDKDDALTVLVFGSQVKLQYVKAMKGEVTYVQ